MGRVYLDHNASSPVFPEVIEVMQEALLLPGNPSSVHAEGRDGLKALNNVRQILSGYFGVQPDKIVFTSGGTEANNLVLAPENIEAGGHFYMSAVEHASVLEGHRFHADKVRMIPVDRQGRIDIAALETLLQTDMYPVLANAANEKRFLVSIMGANNETGVLQPVAEIARLVHARGGLLHCDGVQLPGRIEYDEIAAFGTDYLTLSAHKLGGPKGVGALLNFTGESLAGAALIKGGGQAKKQRAGTENVASIVGMGRSFEVVLERPDRMQTAFQVISSIRDGLKTRFPDLRIFSGDADRVGNTICFALPGVKSESLLMNLDLAGFAVSSGSACSSGKVTTSHVLRAMGVEDDLADCAIRVSAGWTNQLEDADKFLQAMDRIIARYALETA